MPKKWREIGGFKQAESINIMEEEGQVTEGIYDGSQEHVGKNDSMVHYINIDGVLCSFWGSTVLDDRLKQANVGDEVRITYKGKAPSKTAGRKGYNDFKIEIAEGEDEDPTPKITKPVKKVAPVVEESESDEEESGDVPF